MSFPKAKIHRFNEDITCAPPPGSYDPKFEEKIKGAVIDRSKRFTEQPKSSTSSMESLDSLNSSCSKLTTASHPPPTIFRTPQLPKKLTFQNTPKCTEDASRSSGRSLRDIFRHDYVKCLKEKIEQLEKTHIAEIIEKNVEIKNLREEQTTQQEEQEDLKTQHVKEIKEILATKNKEAIGLKNNLAKCEVVIKNEREAYQDRIDQLEVSILSLNENADTLLGKNNDLELVIAEKQAALVSINDKCSDLENVIKQLQEELDKTVLEHTREIEMILLRHGEEVNSVAQASEMNSDLLVDIFQQRIKNFENDFDVSYLKVDCDFQTKLNDVNTLVEDEIKAIKIKVLDTLNVVGDVENKFNEKIELLAASMKEPNEKLECILLELSRIKAENDDLKVESLVNKLNLIDIQEKHNVVEENCNTSLLKCKKYQVVLRDMESTIEVLSKRLYESETEVEKLNSVCVHSRTENAELIKQNNEYKQDNLQLTLMQADIVNQVYEIQKKLHDDLENLRTEANNKEKQMVLVVDEKESVIQILLTERDFYHGKIQEQEKLLEEQECKIQCQTEDIKRLEIKETEVAGEITEKLNAQKDLYSLLDNHCKEMKKHYEADLDSLTNSIDLLRKEKNTLQCELDAKSKNINRVVNEYQAVNEQLASALEKFGLKYKGDLEKMNEPSGQFNVLQMYVQTITDNLYARISEVNEKDSKIESLNSEIEMKNFTLVQVSEEYENIKNLIQEKIAIIEVMKTENRDYIDGLISELVLEKERCGELERKKEFAVREFDELKSDNIEKAGFIVDLSTQIESLEGVNQQVNNMVSCLKMEKQSVEFQLLEARDRISCLEEIKAAKESKIGNLISQVDELSGRVSKQWDEMESLNAFFGKNEQDLKKLLKELEETLKEKELAAQESSKCIQDLNTALNDLETKLSLLNEEKTETITELEKQLKRAHDDLVNTNEDIKVDFDKKIKIAHDTNRDLELRYQAMEKRKNEYKSAYWDELKKAEDELINHAALTEQKERESSKLIELSQQFSEVTARLKETELKNLELECMVGPFRAQLSQYEAEKRALESSKESVQKELCDLENKIAEALGHQNHKQKIRYVTQLKHSNTELKLENDKLRIELAKLKRLDVGPEGSSRRQGLTIPVDKENLSRENSPAGKLKTPRKPQSPSCALKERNAPC